MISAPRTKGYFRSILVKDSLETIEKLGGRRRALRINGTLAAAQDLDRHVDLVIMVPNDSDINGPWRYGQCFVGRSMISYLFRLRDCVKSNLSIQKNILKLQSRPPIRAVYTVTRNTLWNPYGLINVSVERGAVSRSPRSTGAH